MAYLATNLNMNPSYFFKWVSILRESLIQNFLHSWNQRPEFTFAAVSLLVIGCLICFTNLQFCCHSPLASCLDGLCWWYVKWNPRMDFMDITWYHVYWRSDISPPSRVWALHEIIVLWVESFGALAVIWKGKFYFTYTEPWLVWLQSLSILSTAISESSSGAFSFLSVLSVTPSSTRIVTDPPSPRRRNWQLRSRSPLEKWRSSWDDRVQNTHEDLLVVDFEAEAHPQPLNCDVDLLQD